MTKLMRKRFDCTLAVCRADNIMESVIKIVECPAKIICRIDQKYELADVVMYIFILSNPNLHSDLPAAEYGHHALSR